MKNRQYIISIVILAFTYFVIGFISWVNAILIPYFKIVCELTQFWSYLVAFAFYIAYFVMSVPAGFLLKKIGYKRGIMVAMFLVATGAFIFVPAAMTRVYLVFLTGLFTMGTGMAILQSAVNPFVTLISREDPNQYKDKIEKAACIKRRSAQAVQRMSIMGVCNKFAGIISPLIFASFILKASDKSLFEALPAMSELAKNAALDELTSRMIIPYACLGVLLIGAGLFIRYSILPEINSEEESKEEETAASHETKKYIVQYPYLVLGVLAIFTHVGTQIISIDTIIGYATSMGLDLLDAKTFPSFTLTATITGYLIGIFFVQDKKQEEKKPEDNQMKDIQAEEKKPEDNPKVRSRYISQTKALRICTITGLILSCCVLFMPGHAMFKGQEISVSIWFLVLLGLPNSLIYAGIWPVAIRNLGRFTNVGSSMLVMALCGNALFPLLYGHYADIIGTRPAYWVLIPCYLYLVFYAVFGYKITSWKKIKRK